MRLKVFLILSALVLLYNVSSFAQSAGGSFMIGLPMGEFKENVDRVGWGFSGQFLLFPQTSSNPFSMGINVGYLNYGNESQHRPFSETNPDVTVDVDRTNNLVNFHVVFQALMPAGVIRPYAEALFGGSYLFTQTTIRSENSGEEVASSTNFDDFAWSYGGGGGFLIRLSSGDDDQISGVFLDLKARYLLGTEANYLKEGSVTIRNGRAIYDVSKSKTELLTIHAGVVVEFNSIFSENID